MSIFIFMYCILFIKCYYCYYKYSPIIFNLFRSCCLYWTWLQTYAGDVINMSLLIEWGYWTGKYLAHGHDIWGPYFLTESQMYSCLAQPNSVNKHVILWLLVYLSPPFFLCLTRLALCTPSFAAFEQGFFCVVSWQKHTRNCIEHLTIYDNILVALLQNKNGRN